MGIMFLMTDAQVANEQFLVLINDLLASGEVADLFPDDEIENIIGGVRNEVSTIKLSKSDYLKVNMVYALLYKTNVINSASL